jgi:hypothetical protein
VVETVFDAMTDHRRIADYMWAFGRSTDPAFVVMRNGEYSILRSFAVPEKTPGVPGLDLPGLDIASSAEGFGCRAFDVDSTEKLAHEFTAALDNRRPDRDRGAHSTSSRALRLSTRKGST